MKTFEEDVPFEKMVEYAEPYTGKKSFWAAWLRDIIASLMNRQSPYRYIARVALAEKRLQHINDEHMHASKLMLEAVVFNLAPAIKDYAAGSYELFDEGEDPYTDGFESLDDTAVRDAPAAVTARYKTLGEAIERYVEISLKVISSDMEDEEIPDFETVTAELRDKITLFKKQLADAREKLYVDFPEHNLSSVSNFVIHEERSMPKSEQISPVEQEELEKTVLSAENSLSVFCHSLTAQARIFCDKLEAISDRYSRQIERTEVMWNMLKDKIDEERRTATEERIIATRENIAESFSVERHLPSGLIKLTGKEEPVEP